MPAAGHRQYIVPGADHCLNRHRTHNTNTTIHSANAHTLFIPHKWDRIRSHLSQCNEVQLLTKLVNIRGSYKYKKNSKNWVTEFLLAQTRLESHVSSFRVSMLLQWFSTVLFFPCFLLRSLRNISIEGI